MAEAALLVDALDSLRTRVNQQLDNYLRQLGPDCPERLRDAMAYSLLAGGKRLRPLLTLLACEAAGGANTAALPAGSLDAAVPAACALDAALPAACAIEMVHTYSLVHDDLPAMDDDDLRRGRPTCHIQFGEALAILAGDALLTLAFEIVARDVFPSAVAAACCADLASAAGAMGMVAGQVADLDAEDAGLSSLRELEAIHRRKTGRLLCCALTMGGRIAGADGPALESLEQFGKCVGLAFQITDDLLDIMGEQEKMGKGVRKDADHGKLTYPALVGVDQSRKLARELIEQACGSIARFGARGRRLEALAHFVLERDH